MNIKINKEFAEILKSATLETFTIGSHLYGTNTKNSDNDFLHVYATSNTELNTLFPTHHQFQYDGINEDHIFVSLHSFLKNIFNGDSTINYEVLYGTEIKKSNLNFLLNHLDILTCKKLAMCYVGMAERDLKHLLCDKGDNDALHNRLLHIHRGVSYANYIKSYMNYEPNIATVNVKDISQELLTHNIFKDDNYFEVDSLFELKENLLVQIRKLRKEIAEFKEIRNIKQMQNLDTDFLNFCNSELFLEKQKHIDLSIVYDAIANGIIY